MSKTSLEETKFSRIRRVPGLAQFPWLKTPAPIRPEDPGSSTEILKIFLSEPYEEEFSQTKRKESSIKETQTRGK